MDQIPNDWPVSFWARSAGASFLGGLFQLFAIIRGLMWLSGGENRFELSALSRQIFHAVSISCVGTD